MNELYARIAALCEARGISIYRLCKDIGIRASVLSDLNCGRKKGLSTTTVSKIAEYFHIDLETLLGQKKEAPSESISDEAMSVHRRKLLNQLADLSEAEFALVDAFVQGLRANRKGE